VCYVAGVSLLFAEDGRRYEYMELLRNPKGHLQADRVPGDGREVGVLTNRGSGECSRDVPSLCTTDIACAEAGRKVVGVWGEPGSPKHRGLRDGRAVPVQDDNRRADR
jgi:hypothetical protein